MQVMTCPFLSSAPFGRLDASWNQTFCHDTDTKMTVCAVERKYLIDVDVVLPLVVIVEFLYVPGVVRPSNCKCLVEQSA